MVVAAGINQSIIALERQMQQLLSWDKYVKQNKKYIYIYIYIYIQGYVLS